MYKRNAQGWSKHLDFIIVELISLQMAFSIASYFRFGYFPYSNYQYRSLAIVLLLIDGIVIMFLNTMHDVLKRGLFIELVTTFRHCAIVFGIATAYLFALQYGDNYSRIALSMTFVLHVVIGYALRLLWKAIILRRGIRYSNPSCGD